MTPSDRQRWDALRARVKATGLRNSLLVAIAPTATIASIAGCYECIEPQVSNLFKRETLSGDFLQINRYLVTELQERGLWTESMRNRIKVAEGSVQGVEEIPEEVRHVYRTAWEIPMRSLIDMAADRGAYLDQSQSLNLFIESPNIGQLSSMYFYAWKKGLKTTYYLRSRPATRIAKTAVAGSDGSTHAKASGTPAVSAAPAHGGVAFKKPIMAVGRCERAQGQDDGRGERDGRRAAPLDPARRRRQRGAHRPARDDRAGARGGVVLARESGVV